MAIPVIDMSKPGSKGGRTAQSIPSFFFRGQEEQYEKLLDFVVMAEQAAVRYFTEDTEAGKQILEKHEQKASLKHLEKYGSDAMKEALAIARQFMSDKDILEVALDHIAPEPAGGGVNENSLYTAPVGEVEVKLHGFVGKINSKKADLFQTLSSGLDLSDLEKDLYAARTAPGVEGEPDYQKHTHITPTGISGDKLFINMPSDTWDAVVDEDAFIDTIEKMADKKVEKHSYAISLAIKKVLANNNVVASPLAYSFNPELGQYKYSTPSKSSNFLYLGNIGKTYLTYDINSKAYRFYSNDSGWQKAQKSDSSDYEKAVDQIEEWLSKQMIPEVEINKAYDTINEFMNEIV
jgi:hypothetical protein